MISPPPPHPPVSMFYNDFYVSPCLKAIYFKFSAAMLYFIAFFYLHGYSAVYTIINTQQANYMLLLFATTMSVFKSVKVSVVEIAKRTN